MLKILRDDHWRQPHGWFVEQQQAGLPMSARPIASICCSPPDNVPLLTVALLQSWKELEHTIEIGLIKSS